MPIIMREVKVCDNCGIEEGEYEEEHGYEGWSEEGDWLVKKTTGRIECYCPECKKEFE